jgi:D-glycero-alpha-D-manno-heptose-7-phosphate kinase
VIIARSPLRITLGGVSTDLPAWYRDHGGFLVAAAIDKYVYVGARRSFSPGITIVHSEIERADKIDDVKHGIVREALRMLVPDRPQVEIVSFSDVPHGTGLGSSGSFTTALLCALHALHGRTVGRHDLAEEACRIEIEKLREPIGKQDQYIAACGGLTCFTFAGDGTVAAEPLRVNEATRQALNDSIVLFFTGGTRSASNILRDQVALLEKNDSRMLDSLHFEMDNAVRSRAALESGDLAAYGRLLSQHWDTKRKRPIAVSTPEIDRLYEVGMAAGAFGGKLVGAGGAGFLMFCTADRTRLRGAMAAQGLAELPFAFSDGGTRIIEQQA